MKRACRSFLILLTIGTFVSAAQGALAGEREKRSVHDGDSSPIGSCFTDTDVLGPCKTTEVSVAPASSGMGLLASSADTLETYEIELEDEGQKGTNYKAIVGLAIAAAFVGYALYIMLAPEDEESTEDSGGKEPPVSFIRIPFGG